MKRSYLRKKSYKKLIDNIKVERKEPLSWKAMIKQVFNKIIITPLTVVCRATIPCCEEKMWSRSRACLNPFFGVLLILVASESKFLNSLTLIFRV
jgi:hypothetical protein